MFKGVFGDKYEEIDSQIVFIALKFKSKGELFTGLELKRGYFLML